MRQELEREVFGVLRAELTEVLHPLKGAFEISASLDRGIDLTVEIDTHVFLVAYASSASVRSISAGIESLKRAHADAHGKPVVPVIAVPFMGEAGKALCRSEGVSWMDLAGNAHLQSSHLLVRIEGRPKLQRKPGRPANLFAPKSARVTRRLLLEPERVFRQWELAQETGLGEGFVSRIVRQLETEGFLTREEGVIRVGRPDLLLEAWREAYAFDRHHIVRGHIPARSVQSLLESISNSLRARSIGHAVTGAASAWQYDRFAGFRLITLYLQELPIPSALDFRPQERGANVWLIHPNDPGVFDGAVDINGVHCVSAVQTYLDLLALPERSQEAADELRRKQLGWSIHG